MRGMSKHLARYHGASCFDKEERTDEKDIEQCVVLRVYVKPAIKVWPGGSAG